MTSDERVPDPTALSPFDDSQLIARHAPGKGTRHQKLQASRLRRVGQGLRRWAGHFSLPQQHIDRAAYYTVVSTPLELPFGQVMALAETILWIYVFDDFLDQRSATRDSLPEVDQDIRLIAAALFPDQYGFWPSKQVLRPHPPANLLEELEVVRSSREHRRGGERETPAAGIRDALAALLLQLDDCWRELSPREDRHQFRHSLVRRQVSRCMASMRREFVWNVRLADHLQLPSLDLYMMTGSISIGMHAVAAVAASCELDAERAWREDWAAIDTAGRIIRLANDLATYPRELAEGKLSSLTLLLHQPGYTEVDAAAGTIRQALHQLTDFFGNVCRPLTEGSVLRFYLRHIVAFAVAAYREEEEAAAAAPSGEDGAD